MARPNAANAAKPNAANAAKPNAANTAKPNAAARNAARNATAPNAPSNAPRLPLSGSEPTYTDLVYGTARGKGNNNCYGYAIDAYRNSGAVKLQPGNVSKLRGQLDLASCAALRLRALADLRGRAYAGDADRPCKPGYYKIMGFLSKGEDYHWYKQHRDALLRVPGGRDLAALARSLGVQPTQLLSPSPQPRAGDLVLVKNAGVWSHKQGFATGPILRDACGKAITDPRAACRDYGPTLNYREYCGALCVKTRRGAGTPRKT
ncbi:hypothetical protein EBX93_11500 [bacterium]|nr:hypothetical protein [bacterium]